jgi:hypothetical protein
VSYLSSYVYQDVKVCPALFSEKVLIYLFPLLYPGLSEKPVNSFQILNGSQEEGGWYILIYY